ncbi:hypothetical protein VVMO6_03126 [Vibrio vulnificus MO6-24/O]|nr:hypothetical protein VVMO6_03126 [Vibrio vulnificus MO6-24/O]
MQLKPISDSSLYLLSGTVNRAKMLIRDWFGGALVEHQRHTLKGTN